nr:hypothetical protein [Caballeronia catudaia]
MGRVCQDCRIQNAARYALVVRVPVHFLGTDWKASAALIDPKWITVALPVGMANP